MSERTNSIYAMDDVDQVVKASECEKGIDIRDPGRLFILSRMCPVSNDAPFAGLVTMALFVNHSWGREDWLPGWHVSHASKVPCLQ